MIQGFLVCLEGEVRNLGQRSGLDIGVEVTVKH
jgi:hypothetical protein